MSLSSLEQLIEILLKEIVSKIHVVKFHYQHQEGCSYMISLQVRVAVPQIMSCCTSTDIQDAFLWLNLIITRTSILCSSITGFLEFSLRT